MRKASRVALLLLLAGAIASSAAAQTRDRAEDLSAGRLLVARRTLVDPNFAESVVLLVQHSREGAMGLIVNRQTRVPLSRVLADVSPAQSRSDPVYLGGPVEKTAVLALLRAATKPDDAQDVFGDVYMISAKNVLEKGIPAGKSPATFHVFLGYAGWGPGQLEREVRFGSWAIVQAEAGIVFDPDPASVWSRLIKRTEMRIARLAPAPAS